MILFAVSYYDLPCGMAVTASHNPALYNGVKVFTEGGRDASEGGAAGLAADTRMASMFTERMMASIYGFMGSTMRIRPVRTPSS